MKGRDVKSFTWPVQQGKGCRSHNPEVLDCLPLWAMIVLGPGTAPKGLQPWPEVDLGRSCFEEVVLGVLSHS